MINLVFTYSREVMRFLIKEREIYYTDRRWKSLVRCIPKDEKLLEKIRLSRNAIPMSIIKLFTLTEEQLKEYEEAKTEEDLATIVIKDAKKAGCILQKKEVIENKTEV